MDTTTTPVVTTAPAPAPASASASASASTPSPALVPELAVEVIDGLPVEAVRLLIGSHLIGLAEIGELCGHAGSGTVSGWVKREPGLAACKVVSFKAGPVFWAPAVRAYLESKGRIPQQQQQGGGQAEPASESGSESAAKPVTADGPAEQPSEGEPGPAQESPAVEAEAEPAVDSAEEAHEPGEPTQAEQGASSDEADAPEEIAPESQPEAEADKPQRKRIRRRS
ncbi:hypothetical protein ACQEVF_57440 [Nonomuraea polychroma]|uniref:hypothetical protein n=1 Tax=Nonomuraea polychroma TaxID=46176 RepID=UPI003D93CA3F